MSIIPITPIGWRPAIARLRTWRWYAVVPLLYLLLTMLMLWPLVAHLRSAVPDAEADPLLNAWTLRWVQHALVTDPLNLYNANQFSPSMHVLAFSEAMIPQALMAWPIWLVTHDALLSHNLLVLLTYPLCATAMYALCRGLGAVRGGAFVAGLCYAFAPFRLDNASHLQVLSMQWMPLAILAIIRFVQRPSWWRGVAVTLTLALSSLSSLYFLVMFGTGLAVFLLVETIWQRRAFLSRTGIGLGGALVATALILVPFSIPYLQMQHEQAITRPIGEASFNAAHAWSYLTVMPGSLLWQHVLPLAGRGPSALFPGLLLTLLAAVGLVRVRRPWLPGIASLGVVGFVLSFGPTLGDDQHGIPLPYRVLYTHVFGYQGLRGPDRFTVLVLLALCVYAAVGGTWLVERAQQFGVPLARAGLLVTAIVAGGVLLDDGTRLRPMVPVDRSEATLAPYRWLAAQQDTGIVAEFPIQRMETRTAFYSTYHWHPVLWGHSGLTPQAHYELAKRLIGEGDTVGPADLEALHDMGVGTLLVHQSVYSPADFDRMRDKLASAPGRIRLLAHVGDCDIYQLMGPPPIKPMLTVWFAPVTVVPVGGNLAGELVVQNDGDDNDMLYTVNRPTFVVEIRDTNGTLVERHEITAPVPAVVTPGRLTIPFSIPMGQPSGSYRATLVAHGLPTFQGSVTTAVRIVAATALPHLTLTGRQITSEAAFTPGEPVALWITLTNQRTISLPETRAGPGGTIDVTMSSIPRDAGRIVAHGKQSGVELWVAPSP